MMEQVIIDYDKVMQFDSVFLPQPQGPISESPQYFHHMIHNASLILCGEVWPEITVLWILNALACELG